MAMGARAARIPETAPQCDLQSRRAQSLSDIREVRGVLCAGCGVQGEGDGVEENHENDAS